MFNIDSATLNSVGQLVLGDIVEQTDIHGNSTVGTIGGGEVHKFRYDNEPAASDTWFLEALFGVDEIYSTDKISIRWDSFTDNESGGGSGFINIRLVHHPNQVNSVRGNMVAEVGDTVSWEN